MPPFENRKSVLVMPSGLIGVSLRQEIFFLEMYSVAKNASPIFARLQIYTFFLRQPLKIEI